MGATDVSNPWQAAAPLTARVLSPEHRALLVDESGIAPDVIAGRGYYSPTKSQIAQMVQLELYDPSLLRAESWLSIPIVRPDGVTHGEIIRKFPATSKMKYLWPTGVRNTIDVHPDVRPDLLNRDVPLIITEGIKKADAILSASLVEGIDCVPLAINGCWGWKARIDGGSIALPDFYDIPLEDRKVYLVVDSDHRTNDDVRRGWDDFAVYLQGKTGPHRVLLCVVPALGVDKQGADDYLAGDGTLQSLLALGATPHQTVLGSSSETRPLIVKSGKRVLEEALDQIPHLIFPLLPERAILVMAGHSGTFKTWHALGLMLDGAFGLPWLDHPDLALRDRPFATLYVNKEMGGAVLANRLKKIARDERYSARPDFDAVLEERIFTSDEAELDLRSRESRDRVEAFIAEYKVEHVVLDSLSMCWSGNENDNSEVGAFYTQLRGITERTGCSWTIIHHLDKPQNNARKLPAKFSIRGAGQIVQQADAAMILSPFGDDKVDIDDREIVIEPVKTRTDREPPSFVSKFGTNDGFFVSLSYAGKQSELAAHASRTHPDPKVKSEYVTEWISSSLASMPAMAPTSSGLRAKQLSTLLQASWTVEGEQPPSDTLITRHLASMVADGVLELVDANKRHGNLYRFRTGEPFAQGRPRPDAIAGGSHRAPAEASESDGEDDHRSGGANDVSSDDA